MDDKSFQGLPVISLMPGSVAERAGVRCGDRVLIANGRQIETLAAYADARGIYRDRLELTIQRGSRVLDLVLVFDTPDGVAEPAAQA